MKRSLGISAVALTVAFGFVLQSCQKDDRFEPQFSMSSDLKKESKQEKINTFYGPTVPIGNGVARAWVSENKEGDPVAVGINLSEKALANLPDQPAQYVLFFPKEKGKNFYKHMLVDWNPEGHEPEVFYGLPHFDFHFYIVPNEERLAIAPLAPPSLDVPAIDSKYFPAVYMLTPGVVPQMGAHWVDVTSPEFQPGGTFTRTFIWGSYHGEFIFFEPMITRDYLLTHPGDLISIPQPSVYQRSGWYASNYCIEYSSNPAQYTIALLGLTYQEEE